MVAQLGVVLMLTLLFLAAGIAEAAGGEEASPGADPRNVTSGRPIPAENYCDQPYVVIAADGGWLCTLTTGRQPEGSRGQHVVSTTSLDHGRTWSPLVDIEPADGPEASWVMPLRVPGGRVYAFYVYNADDMRTVIADTDYARRRVDTLGRYCFRYSNDNGRTWSKERYEVPMRLFDIDRENPYGGDVLFFWGVGKPVVADGRVYLGMHKVGRFGEGFLARTEGFFLMSDNILTESDPARIRWETLPEGDEGLRAVEGPIAEENFAVALSGGALYTVYRTVAGYPCHAYSRDGGRTWTRPAPATYTPGGRVIKHPRACPRIARMENGNYLLWFHNHGGRSYEGRNPVWVSGGVERDGWLHWSEPEILLYDDDGATRMSYPDWIEEDGRYWVTETQKEVARVHEVDASLLEGLWNQGTRREVVRAGLALELPQDAGEAPAEAPMPRLPRLDGEGFAVDFWVTPDELPADRVILDSRDSQGRGVAVRMVEGASVAVVLGDGSRADSWTSDSGALAPGGLHHVAVIVDGGAGIITFVVDGVLCDGGRERAQGWHRFDRAITDVNGAATLKIAPGVKRLRVYDRYLRTSEAISNFHAGA